MARYPGKKVVRTCFFPFFFIFYFPPAAAKSNAQNLFSFFFQRLIALRTRHTQAHVSLTRKKGQSPHSLLFAFDVLLSGPFFSFSPFSRKSCSRLPRTGKKRLDCDPILSRKRSPHAVPKKPHTLRRSLPLSWSQRYAFRLYAGMYMTPYCSSIPPLFSLSRRRMGGAKKRMMGLPLFSFAQSTLSAGVAVCVHGRRTHARIRPSCVTLIRWRNLLFSRLDR